MQEAISYQKNGLVKLLSLKEGISACEKELNQAYGHIDKGIRKTIDRFISVFCENGLADTDYADVQKDVVDYASLSEYIHRKSNLSISSVIKCITYCIWTDQTNEGYFISKIKDNSLTTLLNRLDVLVRENKTR